MPPGDHDPHRHTGSTPLQLQDLIMTHRSVCSTNGRRKSGFHITQTTKYLNFSNIIIIILSLVTKPPENLTANRTSDTTATVNWSSPESGPILTFTTVFLKI